MEIVWLVILGVLLVLAGYAVVIYNGLVSLKHAVSQAWSNIDVLLKQRHDELPKLVETCKQYMQHERETLNRVIEARSRAAEARAGGDVDQIGAAESTLRLGLGNLFAVAEAYPDLKANQSFRDLQMRISALENSIADRREFYNAAVNQNNVRIEQFPDVLIARMFAFRSAKLLSFDAGEIADVDVKSLFG